MRVRLIIKDREYLKAVIETMGKADKDIYIEVGNPGNFHALDSRTLVLTDYPEKAFDTASIPEFNRRVIFLTHNVNDHIDADHPEKNQHLFKYSSMSSILADVQQINYLWTGETDSSYGLVSRVYAVCSDRSDITTALSQALARQIMFRRGGSILIISLKYVNDYAIADEPDNSRLLRLLYYIDTGKDYPADAFTYNDSYGISYLRISAGLNPVASLRGEILIKMVRSLSLHRFETVILDIGNSYSKSNLTMINKADNIIFFRSDTCLIDLGDFFTETEHSEKAVKIPLSDQDKDIDLRIDDYVRKVYGIRVNESDDKKKTGKKILS